MSASPSSVGVTLSAPSRLSPLVAALVAAIVVSAIGAPWDISWHMTIGRDSFWTPAHIAIYTGGASAGLICGWLALRTTFFAPEAERRAGVNLWGGRAPFGAWVVIWGAIAMLTSAPFDDWWHNAYGLDVKIISPPHIILFLGGLGIRLGVWLLLAREFARTGSRVAAWLICLVGGLFLQELAMIFTVELWPTRQHSAGYFFVASAALPFLLAIIARVSPLRWSATLAAGSYMLFVLLLLWILPLFPGRPGLGPVYHPVTHMVPPPFPQWLILPAFAIDLFKRRFAATPTWRSNLIFAVAVSAAFLLIFFPAQWCFARFYLSPAADNAFFGGSRFWSYSSPPAGDPVLTRFSSDDGWSAVSIAQAFAVATLSAFLGRTFGGWMSKVQR